MQQASKERSIRYYGGAVAAGLAITELTSWGILFFSFSVMVTPMSADLGWSAGTVTGAFAVAFLISGISAIIVGRWLDQFGSRVVMSIGSCIGVVLLLLWSRVTVPVEFYLIWAGLGVASSMLIYEPAFAATATWFTDMRRLAIHHCHDRRSAGERGLCARGDLAGAPDGLAWSGRESHCDTRCRDHSLACGSSAATGAGIDARWRRSAQAT